MASFDVNLVPENELGTSSANTKARTVTIVSVAILAIFGLGLIVIFLIYLFSSKTLNDIRVEKKPIENEILAMATREGLVRSLNAKVAALDAISKKQPPFRSIVDKLIQLQQSDVTYTELVLTNPNKVLITGRTANVVGLENYLANVTAKDLGRQVFTDIVLQSLTRNNQGEYDFSLRFLYTGK